VGGDDLKKEIKLSKELYTLNYFCVADKTFYLQKLILSKAREQAP
jgi:hypothetical protein